MKEKLLNNLGLKILSIFFAFLVWMIVMNVSNPLVADNREVPLEIENEQVLTQAGRTYEISGKSTATVCFDVHSRDMYKIRTSDFRAYIDLAELYDVTGSVQVKVELLNNKDIVYNVEPRPGVVRVKTEELQSKPFELRAEIQGTVEDGYAVGTVSLSPSYLVVEGPISQVGLISYVGIQIDADGVSEDEEGTAKPQFYDANGNELPRSDRIHVSTNEIRYRMTINKVKNLPLDFEISGNVASGYQFTGVECSVKEADVTGNKAALASIHTLMIPSAELNIDGLTEDRVVAVDLRSYLPEGVSLAEGQVPVVEVRLKVERLVNRTIVLTESDIQMNNPREDMEYSLEPSRIEVTVQGLKEELEDLTAENLEAMIELSAMDQGVYRGVLRFSASELFRVISYSEFSLEVSPVASAVVMEPASQRQEENESLQQEQQGEEQASELSEEGS